MEELNKELRQCNLQQFIQQTGVLPAHAHSRTELQEQLEQLDFTHLLQDGYRNGSKTPTANVGAHTQSCTAFKTLLTYSLLLSLPGRSVTPTESPPRPTAKQFLGHPRNLQNPLVSSLNPEGVYV